MHSGSTESAGLRQWTTVQTNLTACSWRYTQTMNFDPCQCKVCVGLRKGIDEIEMHALLSPGPRWQFTDLTDRYDDDW